MKRHRIILILTIAINSPSAFAAPLSAPVEMGIIASDLILCSLHAASQSSAAQTAFLDMQVDLSDAARDQNGALPESFYSGMEASRNALKSLSWSQNESKELILSQRFTPDFCLGRWKLAVTHLPPKSQEKYELLQQELFEEPLK